MADLIRADLGSTQDRDLALRLSPVAVTSGTVDGAERLRDLGLEEQEQP